jgi:hypothetical protein
MKLSIKKSNAIFALFTTTFFSAIATADVPETILLKAEPVEILHLTNEAHNSLRASLAPIQLSFSQSITEGYPAKQKQMATKNQPIIITKATIVAE